MISTKTARERNRLRKQAQRERDRKSGMVRIETRVPADKATEVLRVIKSVLREA